MKKLLLLISFFIYSSVLASESLVGTKILCSNHNQGNQKSELGIRLDQDKTAYIYYYNDYLLEYFNNVAFGVNLYEVTPKYVKIKKQYKTHQGIVARIDRSTMYILIYDMKFYNNKLSFEDEQGENLNFTCNLANDIDLNKYFSDEAQKVIEDIKKNNVF